MIHADTARACSLLEPLISQGYEFEDGGRCVRFTRIPVGDMRIPYISVTNILAEDDPCRYVTQALGGDRAGASVLS